MYKTCNPLALPPSLSLMQPDLHPTRTTSSQRRILLIPHLRVQILDAIEPLQQPDSGKARRRERKLLAQANPGPTIKRQVLPPHLPPYPAFRSEFVGVLAPEVFGAVHNEDAVCDFLVLFDEYRTLSVRTTASWQSRVFERRASVDGHHWVQTEGFVEDVLEILAALELAEGHFAGRSEGAKLFDDDAAQFLEHGRVPDEEEE